MRDVVKHLVDRMPRVGERSGKLLRLIEQGEHAAAGGCGLRSPCETFQSLAMVRTGGSWAFDGSAPVMISRL